MELIELDATAQRALELLTNAGMSDGSIYDYPCSPPIHVLGKCPRRILQWAAKGR